MNTTDDFITDYEAMLREASDRLVSGRRARPRGRPLVAIVAATVVAVAVVVILLRDAEVPRPAPVATFGVFERARAASDSVPTGRIAKLSDDTAVRGLRWSDARRSLVAHGFAVYLVPARDDLCIVADHESSGTGLACAPAAAAAHGELSLRIADGASTITIGVMPDGVSRVSVVTERPHVAVLGGNAFVAPSGAGPGTIRWTDAAGEHSTELPASPLSAGGR